MAGRMRCWLACWFALGALPLSGCVVGDLGFGEPPERADCVEGTQDCRDDRALVVCAHYMEGDYTYWATHGCTGASECREGACVLPGVECTSTELSICVDGAVHACAHGLVLAEGTRCDGEAECLVVPAPLGSTSDTGYTAAVCAIDSTPCERFVSSECRAGAAYTCSAQGYPIARQVCADDAPCTEADSIHDPFPVARCNLEVACPLEGQTGCTSNRIYYCDGILRETVEDCQDHACVVVGGRAECYLAPTGPADLVWQPIPGGTFTAGDPDEPALREEVAVAGFEMLRTEVTVGQFMRCIEAGSCSGRPIAGGGFGAPDGDLPAGAVLAAEARSFCRFVGGELPTAYEWEYAARNAGAEVRYPWGDAEPTCSRAVVRSRDVPADADCPYGPSVACSRADDVTAQGVCDLVGNVAEWVLEVPDVPAKAAARGGSYGDDPTYADGITVFEQTLYDDTNMMSELGFRCVRHGT